MTIGDIIEEDGVYKAFLKEKQIKKNTEDTYFYTLKQFCNLTGKTPTELIEEAEDEEDQRIRMRKRKIKKYLIEFQNELVNRGCSPNTISHRMIAIRAFYAHHDLELPKNIKIKKDESVVNNDSSLVPDVDDIKYAMEFVHDLKYRAIIKLQMSSGMGRAEVLSLKISHFVNAVKEYYDIDNVKTPDDLLEMCKKLIEIDVVPIWQLNRVKINMGYVTFSNPESVTAICEYLLRNPPLSMDSYLFRYADKGTEKRIHDGSFIKYFERVNSRAKFEKRDKRNFFRSHNLRKFFATTLINQHVSKFDIDAMMGHKQKSQDGSYFKPNIDALKLIYLQNMNYLSLDKVEFRHFDSQEYKEIVKGQAEMQANLNAQQDELKKQFAELKEQQEKLEKDTKEMFMQKYILENKDNPEFKEILEDIKKSKSDKSNRS